MNLLYNCILLIYVYGGYTLSSPAAMVPVLKLHLAQATLVTKNASKDVTRALLKKPFHRALTVGEAVLEKVPVPNVLQNLSRSPCFAMRRILGDARGEHPPAPYPRIESA